MKRFSLLLLLSAAVLSCDNPKVEPVTPVQPDETNGSISFEPTITMPSKATETAFEVGDAIGVFAVLSSGNDNKGIISANGNYADNVKYITTVKNSSRQEMES